MITYCNSTAQYIGGRENNISWIGNAYRVEINSNPNSLIEDIVGNHDFYTLMQYVNSV